ncbi:MAG TPA: hypothetical protein DCS18_04255 [Alcanivorax sp.]|nr:hypothetical protein [Alcanivorax sp.]|tara:strand:- start:4251 stop:4655 length:405 start_codon:yes stop_codon:yes gene_type:complete
MNHIYYLIENLTIIIGVLFMNVIGASGALIFLLLFPEEQLIAAIICGSILIFLVLSDFILIKNYIVSANNQKNKRLNVKIINEIIDRRNNAKSSKDLAPIELLEHYLKGEIDKDLAEIREASHNKKRVIERFYS